MNKTKTIIISVLCLLFITVLVADIVVPEQQFLLSSAEAATKVKLNKKKLTMTVGEKYQLQLTGTKEKVKWSSSDKKIATVSKKGLVKAKKAGKATITAQVGKKTYKCKITVKKKPEPTPIPPTPIDNIQIPAAVLFPESISEFDRSDDRFTIQESGNMQTVTVKYPDYRIYAHYNLATGHLYYGNDIQLDNNDKRADFGLIASYNYYDQLINRCFLQKSLQKDNKSVDYLDYYYVDGNNYSLQRTISTAEEDEVFFYCTENIVQSFAGSQNTVSIPANTWMHIIVRDRNIVSCEQASESPYMQKICNVDISGTLNILSGKMNP